MALEPNDLLPHFEREIALLRRSMQTFAQRYPKIAARLAITGGRSDDPHVERLLQSFALMAAAHDIRLEDDVPAFTHALLESLHSAFLRPFPSCAIAQFHGDRTDKQTAPRVILRGDRLVAPGRPGSISDGR
nr:type VI secretion system baseplate subunit TssF [Burkholderia sp. lyk4-R2A-23]